ncbi:MAG: TonB-dependent receptor [Bacteroidetes bacterium]|nr:MAG: TonB-dependent receptor [Bacteroidota bacterium]
MKFIRIILFTLLPFGAFAGNTNDEAIRMQVSGKVVDQSSLEELAGVEVRIKDTDIVTFTDFEGRFSFGNIPAGSYTLEFRMVSYSILQTISDEPDHQLDLTVEMSGN